VERSLSTPSRFAGRPVLLFFLNYYYILLVSPPGKFLPFSETPLACILSIDSLLGRNAIGRALLHVLSSPMGSHLEHSLPGVVFFPPMDSLSTAQSRPGPPTLFLFNSFVSFFFLFKSVRVPLNFLGPNPLSFVVVSP